MELAPLHRHRRQRRVRPEHHHDKGALSDDRHRSVPRGRPLNRRRSGVTRNVDAADALTGLRLTKVARRLEVSPLAFEAFLSGAKLSSAALTALPKILADKNHAAQMARNRQVMEVQMRTNKLSARNLKATLLLDPDEIAVLADPTTARSPAPHPRHDGGRVVTPILPASRCARRRRRSRSSAPPASA